MLQPKWLFARRVHKEKAPQHDAELTRKVRPAGPERKLTARARAKRRNGLNAFAPPNDQRAPGGLEGEGM